MKPAQLAFKRLYLARVYKRFLRSEDGKMILEDLMRFAKYNGDVFHPGEADKTAYYLGMRRLILRMLSFASMTKEEIDSITKENEDE